MGLCPNGVAFSRGLSSVVGATIERIWACSILRVVGINNLH